SGQGKSALGGSINISSEFDITSTAGELIARGGLDQNNTGAQGGHVALNSALGSISLTPSTTTAIDVSSAQGSAGTVLLNAPGSSGVTIGGDILATATGTGSTGGQIMIQAANAGVNVANIDASATNGGVGGTVIIDAGATIVAGSATADSF